MYVCACVFSLWHFLVVKVPLSAVLTLVIACEPEFPSAPLGVPEPLHSQRVSGFPPGEVEGCWHLFPIYREFA